MTHGKAFVFAILVLVAATVSCGGGGTSSSPSVSPTPVSNIAISSVTPDSAVISTPVTVQVTGSGFDSSSVIMFDGKAIATNYINSSLVSTSVPADSATQPADVNVVVSNTSTKQESNALRFRWVKSVSITTTALPNAAQGSSYQVTVAATGGKTPYTWTANSGLPAGMTMSTSGTVSGTPTTAGSYSVRVTVTDSSSPAKTATATLPLTVSPEPLALTSPTLGNASVGKSYTATLTANGGVTPYRWSVATGTLPAGLSLASSTGVISGTPTSSGSSSFTVAVADSSSPTQTQSAPASLTVSSSVNPLAIFSSTLAGGTVGKTYSSSVSATGGTTPYTWSVASGSLPAGLTLAASTGVISGTPTTSGTFSFTMAVADASSPQQKQTAATSITVASGTTALSINSSSVPNGTVGQSYSTTLSAAGGTSPYTWSVSSGSLPNGLTIGSTTGVISGTPTTTGTFNFAVSVTDKSSPAQTKAVSLSMVIGSTLTVSTTSLTGGTVDHAYSATLSAIGGTSPYSWSLTSGNLPSGLNLAATTGVISGTPGASGTYSFTAKVTDYYGTTSSAALSIAVSASTSVGIPPQFNLLLSDNVDYACGGQTSCSSWALPAKINWGGSYTDPIWGTTIRRVSQPVNCSSGTCTSTQLLYPDYSKQQAWNQDGSKMLLKDGSWYHLYDASTLSEISRVQAGGTTSLGLAVDDDVRWANTNPNVIYFSTQSALNSTNPCALMSYNISTSTTSLIHNFSSITDGSGHTCNRLYNGDEGSQSQDDRYFASFLYYNSTPFAAILYDKQTDTFVQKSLGANGLCGASACSAAPDHIMLSPSGNYVIVEWVNFRNVEDGTHARGTGEEVFDKNLNYLGPIFENGQHSDVGYDVNGIEVVCSAQQDGSDADNSRSIQCRKLSGVTTTALTGTTGPNPYVKVLLPCTFARAAGGTDAAGGCTGTDHSNLNPPFSTNFHISMRGSQIVGGAGEGWLLMSTFVASGWGSMSQTLGYGWGASELVAVRVDMTQPTSATWRRIGRAVSVRNNDYNAEPHAVPNRDFTRVVWGSNWGTDGGQVSAYTIQLQ